MADLSSFQPTSDIHICGLCRSEFNDIYNFIEHKKHCTIAQVKAQTQQTQAEVVTHHHAPKFIVHDEGNSGQPGYNADSFVGNVVLPAHESNVAGVMSCSHLLPDACPERTQQSSAPTETEGESINFLYHSSTITIPPQQPNMIQLNNLCYDDIVRNSDVNSMIQRKSAENASTLIITNQSRDQNFVGSCFEVQNSSSQPESTFVTSHVDASALSSQSQCENSNKAISDNTDSPALCPEDLEVGQISEAMIGKLSQKFCPKLQNKLRNIDNKSEKSGKLDPISTFTVKGRKSGGLIMNEGMSNASDNVATKLFPLSGTRLNTSSAPLVEMNNDAKSGCIQGISFEKRERLPGVSDELLEPSTPNSKTCHEKEVTSSVNFERTLAQHSVESLVVPDETQTLENHDTKKNSSTGRGVYKAVFTSPSSGGHRLSVKVPEPNRTHSTKYQSQKEFNEKHLQASFERSNCSTSYKNISKLAELSKIRASKDSSSEVPGTTARMSIDTTIDYNKQDIVKINNLHQDPDCSILKKPDGDITNFLHDSDAHMDDVSSTGGTKVMVTKSNGNQMLDSRSYWNKQVVLDLDTRTNGNKSLDTRFYSDNVLDTESNGNEAQGTRSNGSVLKSSGLKGYKTSTEQFAASAIPADMKCESERIGVTMSDDQSVLSPWSTVEEVTTEDDDVKKETACFNREQSISDKEETVVIVYRREDNSFIMMYKPKDTGNEDDEHVVCERINDEVCLDENLSQHIIESLGKDIIQRENEQAHQLQSVIQPSGQYYLSNLGHNERQIMTDQQQSYLYSVGPKTEGVLGFDCVGKKVSSCLSDGEMRVCESEENIVYIQAADVQALKRDESTETTNVNIADNMDRSRHMRAERKMKESSLRVRQKHAIGGYRQDSTNTDVIITPSHDPRTVVNPDTQVKGRTKTFTCHFGNCSYSTSLGKDFQRHYRTHTGERPYKCDQCGKTFNRSDKLKTHLRCHAGQKPFQCKICSYATVDSGSLKKHMRIHTDERPFQCQICPYASRNSSQLIVHLRTHTGDAPFHCNTCSAQFKIKSDLKRHLRVHTGEKPFECDKCDYRSSNKGNLKTHYKINHSLENEKPCPQCNFATSSMKRLREHIKIHDEARIVKCRVCPYTCNSSTALRSHMMIHNSLRPFRCTFCPYSSKQSGNLKKHVQNIHQDKKHRMVVMIGSKCASDKSHHGRKCARSHENEAEYRPTRRSGSSRKIHTCEMCGCGFVRQDSLRCHLKQHKEKDSAYEERNQAEESVAKDTCQAPPKSLLPQEAPPPLQPVVYRRQGGLDHIVAAASQLYREQYMNGEDFEDESSILHERDCSNVTTGHKENDTIQGPNGSDIIKNQNDFTKQLSVRSQDEHSHTNSHMENNSSNRQQCLMDRCVDLVPRKDNQMPCHKTSSSDKPWQQRTDATSPGHCHGNNVTSPLLPVGKSNLSSSLSSSLSCVSLPSSKSFSASSVKSPPSSLSLRHQQHVAITTTNTSSNAHSFQQSILQQPSADVVRFEPQTVNIQLVSQVTTPMNPVSSQIATGTAQNVLGPLTFPAVPAANQPTTFQILLPSGTHMTQIFPTQQSATAMGHHTHTGTVQQPQIMFQVQQLPVQAKQELVTIPTAVDTSRGTLNGSATINNL